MKRLSLSIMIIAVAALALYVAPAALAVGDVTAPVTTDNAPIGWVNETTTVTFVAVDAESGVARTEYSVDGSGWQTGSQVTIIADLVAHTTDGLHTIAYRSVDNADNVEVVHWVQFGVDTSRPTTVAPGYIPMYTYKPPRIVVGGMAALGYAVFDDDPSGGTADVTLKIRNAHGTLVKTLKYADVCVNIPFYATFRWKLAAGTYSYSVGAKDTAGNTQSRTGTRTFRAYAN